MSMRAWCGCGACCAYPNESTNRQLKIAAATLIAIGRRAALMGALVGARLASEDFTASSP